MPPERLGIFISHSTYDLSYVNDLTSELEFLGFKVFVAHRDIEPSAEWLDEIVAALKSYEIFIAYITNNFKNSAWCDQESGIAYVHNRKIIPIIAEKKMIPYGFLNKYQKFGIYSERSLHPYRWSRIIASKIFDLLYKDSLFKSKLRESVFGVVPLVSNFYFANALFNKLPMLEPFSKDEIIRIIGESNTNRQIYEAGEAIDVLRDFIKRYENDLVGLEDLLSLQEKLQKQP